MPSLWTREGTVHRNVRSDRPTFQQSLLELIDHRRMYAIFVCQLRHSALALHGFLRHTDFDPRVMVPAFLHILISAFLETSRRQIAAYATVRFSGSSSDRYDRSHVEPGRPHVAKHVNDARSCQTLVPPTAALCGCKYPVAQPRLDPSIEMYTPPALPLYIDRMRLVPYRSTYA